MEEQTKLNLLELELIIIEMKERLDNNEQKLNEIELNHSRPIPGYERYKVTAR